MNDINIDETLGLISQQLRKKIGRWPSEGSGWMIESVDKHYLNVIKYTAMKGSSYVKLPPELNHSRKGLTNLKNSDNECFRWCHVRFIDPNANRITKQDRIVAKSLQQLNYDGIDFPVTVKQYSKIEKENNIRINVFGYENKQKFPTYVSKEQFDKTLNLLFITEGDNKHYVLIKDFNEFMRNQTKHNEKKKHLCMYCLPCFTTEA